MLSWRVAVLLASALVACGGSAPPETKTPSPPGIGSAAPAAELDTTIPIKAVEVTESNEKLEIPRGGVTDIDINSSVRLEVDVPKAQAVLASFVNVQTDEVARVAKKLDELGAAVKSQQAALSDLETKLANPPSPDKIGKAISDLGQLEDKALTDLQTVFSDREINELLALGVKGGYAATIERLEAKQAEQRRALDQVEERLERVRFRLQAKLHSAAGDTDLHLDGYDDLPVGTPNVIDKLALPTNLLETAKKAKTAAADIGNLEEALKRARGVLSEKFQDLRKRFEKIAALAEELPSLADEAKNAPWASLKEGKKIIATAKGMIPKVKAVVAPCRAAVNALGQTGADSLEPLLKLALESGSTVQSCVDAVVKEGPALVEDGKTLADDVGALRQAAVSDITLAKAVAARTTDDVDAFAAKLQTTALAEFKAYWESTKSLFGRSGNLANPPTFSATAHTIDRGYHDIRGTSVELVPTAREPGDIIYYRAAVIADGQEAQKWSGPALRVVVTGLHVKVSPGVVFVQALEHQAQDSSFPAAPAASATLHNGVHRSNDENTGSLFWRLLDPGLGIHVAYLDLGPKLPEGKTTLPPDPSMEIGVGGVFQLFGDVLQGGVAYDLQVMRPYWFFGIGLQTATNFGLTIPSN